MAVYTHVEEAAFSAFLACSYDVQVAKVTPIAEGVENSNYLIHTQDQTRYIATLFEKRVQPEDLPFFIHAMQHLQQAGLPCPSPIMTQDGVLIDRLEGRPFVLTSFLEGRPVWRPRAPHLTALGRGLAELHVAGQAFEMTRADSVGRQTQQNMWQECASHPLAVPYIATVEQAFARLQAWPDQLPSGLIHADLFPDNVFFRGEALSGIIDFYFACTNAFAYDVAITLNAWCFEADGAFNITKARQLLSAYERVRPFLEEERQALPRLCVAAALRFLLTRLYDLIHHDKNALVSMKNPKEYLHKLQCHLQVKSIGEYGL